MRTILLPALLLATAAAAAPQAAPVNLADSADVTKRASLLDMDTDAADRLFALRIAIMGRGATPLILDLLNAAPGSDTGQASIPVRIISSLAGGAGGTASNYGSAFPSSGTAAGYTDGTNMQGARVYDADTGAGTHYTLGVVLQKAASGGPVLFGTSTDPISITCVSGCGGAAAFSDNAAFSFGSTSIGNMGAVVDDTATNAVAENSAGAPRMTPQRGLHANLRNASGTEVGTAGAPLRVDPTGTTTQPISASSLPLPTGAALDATLTGGTARTKITDGTNNAALASAAPAGTEQGLIVRNVPSGTQGISASSLPLPTGAATSAIQTDGTQRTKITDGTNNAAVKAASTAAAAADPSLVVALHPTSPLPTGTNSIGTVQPGNTANTTPWLVTANAGTGTFAVNQTQVNGVAVSVGRGVVDTGTQRVMGAQARTYSAGTTAKTATAAGTGVFFNICGSATQTVRVQRIEVSGTVATAAVYGDVVLKKTSAATTAGTATTLTNAPHDSTSAAGTAVAKFYTVLGTAGASVGVISAKGDTFQITAAATITLPVAKLSFLDPNRDAVESVVLRGTAQCLELSFGTTTTNAPTLQVYVSWTEE